VEASRHIEYYLPLIAPEAEVALHVLALTKKQVEHYNLPRNVLKDKDLSKAKFEAQHGKGGCELDALEGIHPGELERLIRNAVKQYDDDSLPDRLEEARSLAEENVLGAWAVDTKKLREEFGIVRDEIQKRARKYSARVQALQKQMAQELRPYQKRLRKLEQEFADVIENFDVEVEDRPAPEIEPDEKDWLFDSRRDYLTQLGFYQRHKTGSDGPLEGTGHRLAVPTREKNGADQ
jgi:hypothetical protein